MIVIAGPCAAESRVQVLSAAKSLAEGGVRIFRASAWKPRTRPGSFEGAGEVALEWLREVKLTYGMQVITEIDCAAHVEMLSAHNIDACWIGARTTCSPFVVAELAAALAGRGIEVYVKNPVCPDLDLWLGAIERLQQAGIEKISAIHRGFMQWGGSSGYRNEPIWEIASAFASAMPSVPLICDASHIAGRAELVPQVAALGLQHGQNGLMIEVHPNPAAALSDAAQQLTPADALDLIKRLSAKN